MKKNDRDLIHIIATVIYVTLGLVLFFAVILGWTISYGGSL